MRKILFVLGTRPEAIKLAPLILSLQEPPYGEPSHGRDSPRASPREAHDIAPEFAVRVAVTAQHRGLLDQALDAFGIVPDHDLNVMQPGQSLFDSTSRIIAALESVLASERPDMVIVQGDTTTTFCGALAAFYKNTPVGHVEAGLRTGDMRQPFPEEMNRVLTSRLATLHFAPTALSASNLDREGIDPKRIFVTGNTGIDAILRTSEALACGRLRAEGLPALDPRKKLILVTAHRRESFGPGFERICAALSKLAAVRDDVEIVYPVHPNPNVRHAVDKYLASSPAIRIIDPLPYVPFVELMRRAHILLTDSGGIQEEGPALGKPVLVMRDKTERPEAVEAGTARLVGTDVERIVSAVTGLLVNSTEYSRWARPHNPYGDGTASTRIREIIRAYFSAT